MSRELHLRRKLTVRAHGQTLVLVKRPYEHVEHVVQKALLWALYLPAYPTLRVEVPLPQPNRYKPDLLALDATGEAIFWGECGEVALDKLQFLLQRFRRTHIVFSKWATRLDPFAALIEAALTDARHAAPVELIGFPGHALEWIADDGTIAIPAGSYATRRWA